MITKKQKIILIAVAIAIAAAAFICGVTRNSNSRVHPKIAPVVEAVYALGIVKTDRWYHVRFGMNAVIQRLYVVEGQEIAAGSPLLMTDSGIIFRAPFAGIITQVAFRESEMAPAGQAIMTLADIKTMYVRVSLDQKSIVQVRKGQKAELSFENLRDSRTEGIVESVYPSSNEFVARIAVKYFPEGVLPEMNCDTAIVIRKKDAALLIPKKAITNNEVEIERKGNRIRVQVRTRSVDRDFSEILEGDITQEDFVVVRPKKNSSQ